VLIGELARHRRSKLSVTLANREGPRRSKSIYLENYFTTRRIFPGFDKKKMEFGRIKKKAAETAFSAISKRS